MDDTKEYPAKPGLALPVNCFTYSGLLAAVCCFLALTNTEGLSIGGISLSAHAVNLILWVLFAALFVVAVFYLVEVIKIDKQPMSTIRLTRSDFSIPMNRAAKRRTLTARYDQITKLTVRFGKPSRLLRIHTSEGIASIAEMNTSQETFEKLCAEFVARSGVRIP